MTKIDLSKYTLTKSEGVFTFKNSNTTIGFVRFSDLGKVEYIFVNPMFRKQGLAKKLLKLVKNKTGKNVSEHAMSLFPDEVEVVDCDNTYSNGLQKIFFEKSEDPDCKEIQ